MSVESPTVRRLSDAYFAGSSYDSGCGSGTPGLLRSGHARSPLPSGLANGSLGVPDRPASRGAGRVIQADERRILPESRTFAELLIDCEENRTLRAVLVGMLAEKDRKS